MINAEGRRFTVEQDGHLNTTTHETVLKLLERRSLRLRKQENVMEDSMHNWSVDETGTIEINKLNLYEIEKQEKLDMIGVSDEVLRVHGVMPGRKQDRVTRLIYENCNSLPNRLGGNHKLEKMKDLIHEWEADLVGIVEHRQNMKHKQNVNGWNKLFRRCEEDVRSIVAHNTHENELPVQEGGTGILAFGPLIEYLDVRNSGKDTSGLGRWTMMLLKGDGIQTRVICGYNPCKSNKAQRINSGTSYAQHRRYLIHTRKDITTCPRDLFREELVQQLQRWRDDGDRLIVCMDANENTYKGSIGKALTDKDGLAMKEVVREYTNKDLGATYFRGSEPIDGIWATSDVVISNACVMPAGYGIGDHRMFVVDIVTSSMVGVDVKRIQRAKARRLNTKLPGVAERYAKQYEMKIS